MGHWCYDWLSSYREKKISKIVKKICTNYKCKTVVRFMGRWREKADVSYM